MATPMFSDASTLVATLSPAISDVSTIHEDHIEEFSDTVRGELIRQLSTWMAENRDETVHCYRLFGAIPFIVSHWGLDPWDKWTVVMVVRPHPTVPGQIGVGVVTTATTAAEMFEHTFGRSAGTLDAVKDMWTAHLAEAADEVAKLEADPASTEPCAVFLSYVGPTPTDEPTHLQQPSEN